MFDAGVSGDVAALVETGRAENVACATKVFAATELVRSRRADGGVLGAEVSGEFAAAEVATALEISTAAARSLVHLGEELRDRLPGLGRAFRRGELGFLSVRAVVDRVVSVADPAQLAEIEAQVLDVVLRPGRCTTKGQVERLVDRVVARLDPELVRARRERAVQDRDVTVRPDADGMASLFGVLPGEDGLAVDRRLRDMAASVCRNDPRSQAQRRSDALGALSRGETLTCACAGPDCAARRDGATTEADGVAGGLDDDPAGEDADDATADGDGSEGLRAHPAKTPPRRHRCRPEFLVIVDANTLAGASDAPGVLAGMGILDADTIRRLAANATWRRLLTRDGDVVDVGRRLRPGETPDPSAYRYEPCERLAVLVRTRDGHCRFPGCTIDAAACDLDHIVAFDHDDPTRGGLTTADNLQCLCRWHHRSKTRGGWAVTAGSGGELSWTGPSGQVLTTAPNGLPPPAQDARVPDIDDEPPPF